MQRPTPVSAAQCSPALAWAGFCVVWGLGGTSWSPQTPPINVCFLITWMPQPGSSRFFSAPFGGICPFTQVHVPVSPSSCSILSRLVGMRLTSVCPAATTVRIGRRHRGSPPHSWTAAPMRRSWISIITWTTFGATGQTLRSTKQFCTCARHGQDWRAHYREDGSLFLNGEE